MDVQSHYSSDRLRRDIAYIRGLMEGQVQENRAPEGKVLNQMIQLLDGMAEDHERLNVRLTELEEYVEAVDEDLNEVELLVYDEMEDAEDEEDIGFWEMTCPDCHESILVNEEIFESGGMVDLKCPQCDTLLIVSDEGDVNRPERSGQSPVIQTAESSVEQ